MRADAWAALAAWFTVAIALGTVIVAGVYARRQVEEAKNQVREARNAREEQAQPNVVVFMEPNRSVWESIELAVKNFGSTPAYDVRMKFYPEPRVSPSNLDDRGITDLPYPKLIPFLAPGQEWRTAWDFGPDRLEDDRLEKRHEASVHYVDSNKKPYTTRAVLDLETLESLRQVGVSTINDVARSLEHQNRLLAKVVDNLAYFATEHRGIWVYHGDAETESQHRTEANAERRRRHDALIARTLPRTIPNVTPPTSDRTYEPRSTEPPEPEQK